MIAVGQLRGQIKGRVIEARDPEYDDARKVFVGGVDRRPALIVRVVDSSDVAAVIAFARETGLDLAVRSGGHSWSGDCVADGGIVIDLRDMRAVTIDDAGRTAWAETGLTARDYSLATHQRGMATGFGDTGSVGIGGLTLGGGVGYLSRKHGLTIDNLIAAEIVAANGDILRADAETNPDLFWAIRGGGGNFGIATRFHFRLHEVGAVYGGMLMLPATVETIASFVAAAQAAPDALTTIANVIPAPPMPFVAAEEVGKRVVLAFMVYAGPPQAGELAMAPFRALAKPIADMLRPMPYPEIYPPDDPSYHPIVASRNLFIDTLEQSAAETIVEHLQASDAKFQATQIRVLGGAIGRVPSDATAYAHRARPIMVNVAALYDHPDEAAKNQAWAENFRQALQSDDPGAYVNFMSVDWQARMHEAYPHRTWERLAAIKARYDPTNLFRLNQNVPPAPGITNSPSDTGKR
ncbi:MAG: FAD-binding oxidoreductase [Chloroflexi bacterium]|nr:MAG: FAD-binding oxidoreductase [Chloroflexota bacterium]